MCMCVRFGTMRGRGRSVRVLLRDVVFAEETTSDTPEPTIPHEAQDALNTQLRPSSPSPSFSSSSSLSSHCPIYPEPHHQHIVSTEPSSPEPSTTSSPSFSSCGELDPDVPSITAEIDPPEPESIEDRLVRIAAFTESLRKASEAKLLAALERAEAGAAECRARGHARGGDEVAVSGRTACGDTGAARSEASSAAARA